VFTALAWLTAAAAASGLEHQSRLALLLVAALAGYLLCTVLLRTRSRSRVFLGSAGGLMVGFALGWLTMWAAAILAIPEPTGARQRISSGMPAR
jgi:UDP-GlcNAc:undecaprenyl-phosphate GlcNAc-1-phosphate transferase